MKSISVIATLSALLIAVAACSPAMGQTCPPGNQRVAPDSRYIDHGNGTVTDQQTGLMWKRCSEGQSGDTCSGVASAQHWQQALASASGSNFAGHSDWRLPNAKELQSLVETGCYLPSINSNRFPNTVAASFVYWTSTSLTSVAWCISFYDGGLSFVNKQDQFQVVVRLVRAGL